MAVDSGFKSGTPEGPGQCAAVGRDPGYRLVLEIEVPDFYVDATTTEFCEEHELEVVDVVTEEWMREEVGLTFVSIPGEKETNSDFEVHARVGRIVGARIVEADHA